MGPPELPGGNERDLKLMELEDNIASMGPPELPGGNQPRLIPERTPIHLASMGPPELPGGNVAPSSRRAERLVSLQWGRRNYPAETGRSTWWAASSASPLQWGRRNYPAETLPDEASHHRRRQASMGPPELPGGNSMRMQADAPDMHAASMGPPELPGGNQIVDQRRLVRVICFNGAAGITRRKQTERCTSCRLTWASMGPPELPGGNLRQWYQEWLVSVLQWGRRNYPAETAGREVGSFAGGARFNGAAGITRRKRANAFAQSSAVS